MFWLCGNKQNQKKKKNFSHNLVQKQVDNEIINVLIIVKSIVSILDVNVGKTKRIYVWNTFMTIEKCDAGAS